MKIVLRAIQHSSGLVDWVLDEEESEIEMPEYDGTDSQVIVFYCVEESKGDNK